MHVSLNTMVEHLLYTPNGKGWVLSNFRSEGFGRGKECTPVFVDGAYKPDLLGIVGVEIAAGFLYATLLSLLGLAEVDVLRIHVPFLRDLDKALQWMMLNFPLPKALAGGDEDAPVLGGDDLTGERGVLVLDGEGVDVRRAGDAAGGQQRAYPERRRSRSVRGRLLAHPAQRDPCFSGWSGRCPGTGCI